MLTFEDVVVAPTAAMGWRPEPVELKTGPIWPGFAAQVEARHCRGFHPSPYDTVPDAPTGSSPLLEEAAWCGPWCIHFGHAIADFGMRIAQSAHGLPGVPLLFTADPRGEPPGFFHAILDLWGVEASRVRLVREPLRVRRLHVVPQAERMHGPPPSDAYLDLLDRIVGGGRDAGIAGRTVFLSRGRVRPANPAGCIAGEGYVEGVLAAAGVAVAYPEALTVAEQAALYRNAGRLFFSEGSALHGLQLVGRIAAPVAVLTRRPGERMAEHAVRARTGRAEWLDAVDGAVLGMRQDGRPDLGTGVTVLDPTRLLSLVGEELGLNLAPLWDERAYRAACLADVERWVAHRAAARGRHHDPEGDAATVSGTAAGVAMLREAGFDVNAVPAAGRRGPAPITKAAAFLARTLGLPPEDFASGGVPGARTAAAVARAMAFRNVVTEPRAADPEESAYQDRVLARWRFKPFKADYEARNDDFLRFREGRIHSPLTDRDARVLGHLPVGHGQATICLDGDEVILLLAIGREAIGMLYPARRTFVGLSLRGLPWFDLLKRTLEVVLGESDRFAAWLRRAMEGRLERAFVLGDQRIGHFVSDSLSYLHATEEAGMLPFLRGGGRLLLVEDWCAMDPLVLFPALAAFPALRTDSAGMTRATLELGLDAHRVYRVRVLPTAEWLRGRIAAARAAGTLPPTEAPRPERHFTVLVSVDAEKERFVNQAEALRFALGRLAAACAEDGSALDVVWDGWTVSGAPGERDREVMDRIEATIAAVTNGMAPPPARQVRVFDRSALGKVPVLEGCDLVLLTRGTAALVPCWLLGRPTVHYHSSDRATFRSGLDESVAFEVDRRAVEDRTVALPSGAKPDRFAVAPWGLEEAMARAAAPRLRIMRTAFPPDEGPEGAGEGGAAGMAVPAGPS